MKSTSNGIQERKVYELDDVPPSDLGNDGDYSLVYHYDKSCHSIPEGEYWVKRYGRWHRSGVVNVNDSQH